ncbi:Uncharacterized protein ESCO_006105 [Escovopsis weberi]|uniref:Mitochondrial integral membrane protein n=1 Tax=Escovopsis weberi TaxID=150374 RepID=A0A0M8MVJ1_ESCWE|nr:Uncharacterized protein ESCO_006105 [Escovopsis weberi]
MSASSSQTPKHRRDDEPSGHRASVDDQGPSSPPDEHSRLLTNRTDTGRENRPTREFLDPDDPAVSPYNLCSIRLLRYLTIFFAVLTFVWWVILLVSAFATPPGFHLKGSGFLALSFTSLNMANMIFTLTFFRVPSRALRVLTIVIAAVLALDMILVSSVSRIRYEEGWVGVTSVVWTLLLSLWTLSVDRVVQWGKAEEEERLTGRAETRRSLTEWGAVTVSTVAYSIMAIAVLLITMTLILRAVDAAVRPPGELYWVDSDAFRLHLYCSGDKTDSDGEPVTTVLFEGGERTVESGLWDLADRAVQNGSIARYCFVDRPGLGWSDAAPSPTSAGIIVDSVSEALVKAGETGPWVLAGAGVGSLYSRVFSARHSHNVRGMLLMDPLHEDLLGPLARPGRGFMLWLRGVMSPLGLDRLPGAIFKGRTSRDRIYGRSAQQGSKFTFAKLQESLVLNSFTRRDVESARQIQERDMPLVVVSSGREVRRSDRWAEKQRDLTRLTDKLLHWDLVEDAPHEVWRTTEGRQRIEKRLKQLV